MYQIGIVSKPSRDLYRVRAEMRFFPGFELKTFTDAPNAVSSLKKKELHALVVLLDQFTEKQIDLLKKIRTFHPELPVAFLTPTPSFELQKKIHKMPKTILLSWEFDITELPGLVHRMIHGHPVYNRHHKRQKAMQSATMVNASGTTITPSCILDLSSAGARVRAFAQKYKKNDEIVLKIPLTHLNKSYSVKARVVWSAREKPLLGSQTQSQLLGLRFLSVAG